MQGPAVPSFCITPIPHGMHRIDGAWVFQYEQAGEVAVFTIEAEAPSLVERGLPRHQARLPAAFRDPQTREEVLLWRVAAARRMADHLRKTRIWAPEAIDLSELESYDGLRPATAR